MPGHRVGRWSKGAALVARPKGCGGKEYAEIRAWCAKLLKDSRKSAKEAEALFLSQWEDRADTAPREHINPQRDWSGITNKLHRAAWVLLRVRIFSDSDICGLLSIHPKALIRIKRILKNDGF